MPPTAPIIYIIFNRPETVVRSFPLIRQQKPRRLHIIADGPRANKMGESLLCQRARALVEGMIDWECTLTKDYSEINLGAGNRIASGLTTAFDLLGEAIVLEDDILPGPEFFHFCTALLEQHRGNSKIHSISGFTPLEKYGRGTVCAVPSKMSWSWGWASWNRAWKDFRFDVAAEWGDPKVRSQVRDYVSNDFNFGWYAENIRQLLAGEVDAWDFQWMLRMLREERLCLISTTNLIGNIGDGASATHTSRLPAFARRLKVLSPQSHSYSLNQQSLRADPIHDTLFGLAVASDSPFKLLALRLLAKYPHLARFMLTIPTGPK